MNDLELLQEISRKLSVLISIAIQKNGVVGVQEHVLHLSRFGLSTGEIAQILSTTSGTVAVAKNRAKKRQPKD
jgi:hypothetical protein